MDRSQLVNNILVSINTSKANSVIRGQQFKVKDVFFLVISLCALPCLLMQKIPFSKEMQMLRGTRTPLKENIGLKPAQPLNH